MAEINTCPIFWTEHPYILIKDAWDFFPFSKQSVVCSSSALNSLTRFGFYLGLALFILTRKSLYLGIPVLAAIFATALYYGMKEKGSLRQGPQVFDKPSFKEGFTSGGSNLIEGSDAADKIVIDIIGSSERTVPNGPNPYMNVLINEISEYPKKPPAKYLANSEGNESSSLIDSQFENRVYTDPGDVWNRNQSQRQFYTMPSTSIPNDRDSYQNWLYRVPGKTCKEGNMAACTTQGSDGSPIIYLGGN